MSEILNTAAPLCVPADFDRLVARAAACTLCSTMAGRRRVLSRANGNPDARVMFVAEAPGRLGGELTGVPLSRDQSGRRFERLLARAGLTRDQIFITNAVLCNPRATTGNNRPPATTELANCSHWLAETIAIVDPAVVVSLGAVALAALGRLTPHGLRLRADVARPASWNGRWLYPLYHPSPRAGLSRSYVQQDEDFRRLGEWLRYIGVVRTFDPPNGRPYDHCAVLHKREDAPATSPCRR